MNREGRTRLRKAAEKFNRESRQSIATFTYVLVELHDEEQEKLDNLPEQLACSTKGEQLEESLECIENLLSGAEEMEETIDSVLSEQGLSFSFVPQVKSERMESEGRGGTQFHAILPTALLLRLKNKARETGLSMNEIVCRALSKELVSESILSGRK